MRRTRKRVALLAGIGVVVVTALVVAVAWRPLLEAWYLPRLEAPDAAGCEEAAHGLGELGSTRAIEPLLDAVAIGRIRHQTAVDAFVAIGEGAGEPLVDALATPVRPVCAVACEALLQLRPQRLQPWEDDLRAVVFEGLSPRPPSPPDEFVAAAVGAARGRRRRDLSIEWLGAIARGHERAFPFLVRCASGEGYGVADAVEELSYHGRRGFAALQRHWGERLERAPPEVLFAAREFGPLSAPASPTLIALLDHPYRHSGALISLGRIGPAAADAIPTLERVADTATDDWIVSEAMAAIGSIGPAGLPSLQRWLLASAPKKRQEALRAVRRLGPTARELVSALIDSLAHEDGTVRFLAAIALRAIGPAAAAAAPALLERARQDEQPARSLYARVYLYVAPLGDPRALAACEPYVDPSTVTDHEPRWLRVPSLSDVLEDSASPERPDDLTALTWWFDSAELLRPRAAVEDAVGMRGLARLNRDGILRTPRDGDAEQRESPTQEEYHALRRLARIELPYLIELLDHDALRVRLGALELLRYGGSEVTAARDAVVDLLADEHFRIRDAAVRALRRIGLDDASRARIGELRAHADRYVRYGAEDLLGGGESESNSESGADSESDSDSVSEAESDSATTRPRPSTRPPALAPRPSPERRQRFLEHALHSRQQEHGLDEHPGFEHQRRDRDRAQHDVRLRLAQAEPAARPPVLRSGHGQCL